MADLRHFLSDIEDDVRAFDELTDVLITLHDHGRAALTPAEGGGIMRVLYLQQGHARSLLALYEAAHEATKAEAHAARMGACHG